MIKLKVKKSNFTTPIITNNGNYKIIQFRFNGERFRMSFDLNKIKDLKKRSKQFELYRDELERRLHNGWNPNDNEGDVNESHFSSLTESLNFALQKKEGTIRDSTFKDYQITVAKFIEQSKKLKLSDADIKDVTRKDILSIFSSMTTKYKWSNKTYNKYLGNIRTLFSDLYEWEHKEKNICRDIRLKKSTQSDFFEPANDIQMCRIKSHRFQMTYLR